MSKGTFGFTLEQLAEMIMHQQQLNAIQPVSTVSNTTTSTMTQNTVIVPVDVPAVMPTNRCSHSDCKKKLLLSDPACKCNVRFCMPHRMPESHNCTYDFKAEGRVKLEKDNPIVKAQMFEKI
jgi:hypothetical protein